jgi:hypothetical protein
VYMSTPVRRISSAGPNVIKYYAIKIEFMSTLAMKYQNADKRKN